MRERYNERDRESMTVAQVTTRASEWGLVVDRGVRDYRVYRSFSTEAWFALRYWGIW